LQPSIKIDVRIKSSIALAKVAGIAIQNPQRRMKQYLSVALALTCAVLVAFLIVMKRSDDAQHESDAGAIDSFSNQLTSAQTQIAIGNGTILTLSNSLDASQSASLTVSNQLTAVQSTVALDAEQIAGLNRHAAEMETENQALSRRVMDLTNQTIFFMKQNALTEVSLEQANKNYALLENRLRIDVAERTVVERKFNDPSELQSQMQKLKANPAGIISPESIYSGLGVEVNSNGSLHVISPN
jgi:hypothetical protein